MCDRRRQQAEQRASLVGDLPCVLGLTFSSSVGSAPQRSLSPVCGARSARRRSDRVGFGSRTRRRAVETATKGFVIAICDYGLIRTPSRRRAVARRRRSSSWRLYLSYLGPVDFVVRRSLATCAVTPVGCEFGFGSPHARSHGVGEHIPGGDPRVADRRCEPLAEALLERPEQAVPTTSKCSVRTP